MICTPDFRMEQALFVTNIMVVVWQLLSPFQDRLCESNYSELVNNNNEDLLSLNGGLYPNEQPALTKGGQFVRTSHCQILSTSISSIVSS